MTLPFSRLHKNWNNVLCESIHPLFLITTCNPWFELYPEQDIRRRKKYSRFFQVSHFYEKWPAEGRFITISLRPIITFNLTIYVHLSKFLLLLKFHRKFFCRPLLCINNIFGTLVSRTSISPLNKDMSRNNSIRHEFKFRPEGMVTK